MLGEGGAFSDTLIDLSSGDSTNVMIAGKVDNVNSGNAIASGDIDADGYDDIMVASVSAATNGTGSGEVYVKYGSSALPAVVDLLTDADLTVIGEAGSYLGYGVGSGDIDRDGYGDPQWLEHPVLRGLTGKPTSSSAKTGAFCRRRLICLWIRPI